MRIDETARVYAKNASGFLYFARSKKLARILPCRTIPISSKSNIKN